MQWIHGTFSTSEDLKLAVTRFGRIDIMLVQYFCSCVIKFLVLFAAINLSSWRLQSTYFFCFWQGVMSIQWLMVVYLENVVPLKNTAHFYFRLCVPLPHALWFGATSQPLTITSLPTPFTHCKPSSWTGERFVVSSGATACHLRT